MEEFSRELPDLGGAAVRGEAVAECALPPAGWYCMRAAGHSGPCAAVAKPIDHEAEILEVIGQRDKYHDMADQLAAQIAAMTEVDIGEHSSANDPWRNALIAGDEFLAAKFKAFCNGPVSARAADALDSQPTELPADCSDEMYRATTHICNLLEREEVNAMWRAMREVVLASSQPTDDRCAEVRARIADAVTDNLRGLYYCGRVWSAWNVGTMGEDNFSPAEEDGDIIANITDAVMATLAPASSQPTDGGVRNG